MINNKNYTVDGYLYFYVTNDITVLFYLKNILLIRVDESQFDAIEFPFCALYSTGIFRQSRTHNIFYFPYPWDHHKRHMYMYNLSLLCFRTGNYLQITLTSCGKNYCPQKGLIKIVAYTKVFLT